MGKRTLWRSIARSITGSWGRFLSIVGLMALGSFALVGLTVVGPDMRATARTFLAEQNAADITVLSSLGLNDEDRSIIDAAPGASAVEYGYLKDVAIDGTSQSVRVQSTTGSVSQYRVSEGRMPASPDEIALSDNLAGEYRVGDTIAFDEKPDAAGSTVLVRDTYTVVGFIGSPEIVAFVNMGASTAGSGELGGYAAVAPEAFDSDVYMTARITYGDLAGLDPYSDEYADKVAAHKRELEEMLAGQPDVRLAEVKADQQARIDSGQDELDAGRAELAAAGAALDEARAELDAGAVRIAGAERTFSESAAQASRELAAAASQLADGFAQVDAAERDLRERSAELEEASARVETGRELIDEYAPKLDEAASFAQAFGDRIAPGDAAALVDQYLGLLLDKVGGVPAEGDPFHPLYAAAVDMRDDLEALSAAGTGAGPEVKQALVEGLASVTAEVNGLRGSLDALEAKIDEGEQAIDDGRAELSGAREELSRRQTDLDAGRVQLAETADDARAQLDAARAELAEKQAAYDDALAAYRAEQPEAEARLAEAEADLVEARERLANLTGEAYQVDTRREVPGSDGYKVYASIADIVDSLSRVFPAFFYFVAALVTFTTMTRFVDEERVNCGTLAALGYGDRDVARKFIVYGFVSSAAGSLLGIVAGHILIPLIAYGAFAGKFTISGIELHVDLGVSALALVLGLVSAVLPALLSVRQLLSEKPSRLLLPKAPASGSRILLERIRPIWNRLSFTHKVTARNLFRYKKRMFMTVFGVCGAVMVLVAGFGVQFSISGIASRQFGPIVGYDMIVADSPAATSDERGDLAQALGGEDVERVLPMHYESLTREAGAHDDAQEITLIVPESPDDLASYIRLRDRATGDPIELGEDGAVVSERLASLLGVGPGDSFTVEDALGDEHTVRVTGVTEMYMGHFLFMGARAYEGSFGDAYSPNASLVTLVDGARENVNEQAAEFMGLPAVAGVVQNTSLLNQIDTIVTSLNKIMVVLIVVGSLLAGVILYNLTTINISERIRELSTVKVLGFFDGEVTMYTYRETILLTALGILAGYGMGVVMRNYIVTVVPPENVMFCLDFAPHVFLIPLAVVGAITVLLGFAVRRRLERLDMLEALKSVE